MLTKDRVIICKDYDEMSRRAADVFVDYIKANPTGILGLATGSSPEGIYSCLIEDNKAGKIDFSGIKTYNLDEYYPIEPTHDQSYRYFMNDRLFDHVNIDKANTFVPDGKCEDPDAFYKAYDEKVAAAGGIGVQLLGVGRNGHIGFNEPGEELIGATHLTSLCESTIDANSRFFASRDLVPTQALTMGIGQIMAADKVLLIALGKGKAEILEKSLFGPVTPNVPASILQFFKGEVIVCADEAALAVIKEKHSI